MPHPHEFPHNLEHGGYEEISENHHLPAAVNRLLTTGIDAVIARNMVSNNNVLTYLEGLTEHPVVDALYDAVPELSEVDDVVRQYWEGCGYSDFVFDPDRMTPSHLAHGSIGIHTDYGAERVNPIFGPTILSVATQGSGQYEVQKPDQSFQSDSGTWDVTKWKDWKRTKAPTKLRTSFKQRAGDGVFIMNHPTQSFHAVKASRGRKAIIFDYVLHRLD